MGRLSRIRRSFANVAPMQSVARLAVLFASLTAALALTACHNIPPVDTAPLDAAGMTYDAIQQLKALNIATAEVASVASARRAGVSDSACVQLVEISRSRNQAFDTGETAAGLAQAGIGADAIVRLAQLNQLGLGAGELQAMKLAQFPDDIILEVARHHSEQKPVLGGASLAQLKNSGLREATLLGLAQHSVPDSEAPNILALRKHGASDVEILRRFAGS